MYNFFINNIVIFDILTFCENYIDKNWLFFSNVINIILISFYIILLGIIFPNKAKIVKFLNLISAFYLLIFFYLVNIEYIYNIFDINVIFGQNYNLYVNFFFIISTITVFLFLLSISDIFFIEENMKIEYTLLVIYIYISSLLLISSLDFISIIILLECIAFSSYILVGFERKNKFSTSSALKYLILASIPGGFFILGISLLYNSYGSFYQDYLELLLVSFDKLNLIRLDWWYTTQYYYTKEFSFNIENNVYYINNLMFLYLINYLNEFHALLKIFNPEIIICIIEMENDFSLIREHLLIPQHLNNYYKTHLNFTDNIVQLENFYIDYYSRYLYIIDQILTFVTLWETLNYIQGAGFSTWNKDIVNDVYIFLGNNLQITSGILDWISFFSYYIYQIEYFHGGLMEQQLLNVFYSKHFEEVNLLRLTKESFHKGFFLINESFFWDLIKKLDNWEYLLIKNVEYTFIKPWIYCIFDNNHYEKVFNFYNYFIEPHNLFFISNFDFKLESYDYNFIINLCNYNNIFLSTYLVIVFILINLSFKITAAPFHLWAPGVYGGSPLPTITFLSVFSKLTIIFFFLNIFLTIFDNLKFIWQPILFFLGIFSIFISIIGAFSEKLFKRFFIYSSIGHVGFMILGIAVLNYEGIQGTIDYLIIYIISSFIVWFIVMHLTKKTTHLISFKGLSYNYPVLSLILVISLFSISGLPPMGGFFVKFEIFYSLLNSSKYYIGYLLLLSTVASFFYYLRLIKIIYFENNKELKKNKNLNDIKLRLISILILILPFYILFIQEPFFYIIKEIIITSIK